MPRESGHPATTVLGLRSNRSHVAPSPRLRGGGEGHHFFTGSFAGANTHLKHLLVDQPFGRDPYVDHPVTSGTAALHLDGDIFTIGQPVNDSINTPVQEWQEDVKRSTGLLDELGPHEELSSLARCAAIHQLRIV